MTILFAILATILGLIIGSFLNVVTHRGPAVWKLVDDENRQGNFAFPRSYCPTCNTPLKRIHLVPLFSFLALRGQCAACGSKISLRYPIVEALGGIAALTAFLLFGLTATALFAAVFMWFLIALAAIDFETGYLPDALTLPLLVIGLAANSVGFFATISAALIGAVAGYLSFRLIGAAFHLLRGAEGLGQGDAKLLAAIGAWLGWMALAPTVFIATMIALLGALMMRFGGQSIRADTEIRFGPALALAAVSVLLVAVGAPEGNTIRLLLPISP